MWRGSNNQLWLPAVAKIYNLKITNDHRQPHGGQHIKSSKYSQIKLINYNKISYNLSRYYSFKYTNFV